MIFFRQTLPDNQGQIVVHLVIYQKTIRQCLLRLLPESKVFRGICICWTNSCGTGGAGHVYICNWSGDCRCDEDRLAWICSIGWSNYDLQGYAATLSHASVDRVDGRPLPSLCSTTNLFGSWCLHVGIGKTKWKLNPHTVPSHRIVCRQKMHSRRAVRYCRISCDRSYRLSAFL
jgi:hypothetical protein